MLIVTTKVPRRRYLLLGALGVLALLLALLLPRNREEAEKSEQRVETEEQRLAYLSALGWEVDPAPVEALRLTLPDPLAEPYLSYNQLQLKQGFDLTPLAGETLDRYTYTVKNYPGRGSGCQADLYLYDGTVVAGDIVCAGENGFIATLEFPGGEDQPST